MPISGMRFTGPAAPNMFDLHVLRGQSVPELSGRLEVRDQDDDEWKSFVSVARENGSEKLLIGPGCRALSSQQTR